MSRKVLEMKNITKKFMGVTALNKVYLDLMQGEILAICGENGAGKSTLMKILSGSYPDTSFDGEIYIDGQKVAFHSTKEAENKGIEMIYQEISLHLDLSVAENIFLGNLPIGKLRFVNWKKAYEESRDILKLVGLKTEPTEIVRNLSTSQQQLIAIARALMRKPRILVLDEPTSALTDLEAEKLFSILNNLKKNKISCIYISHKLDEVFCIADRITVLRDGYSIATYNKKDVNSDKIIEDMVGRKIESLYPKEQTIIGEEILKVEGITIPHPYTSNKKIVDGVSFSLRKGEILGLAGLVGAGRSELLNAIFGVYSKGVTGKVFFEGKEVPIKKPGDAKKLGIGYVTEDRKRSGFIGTMSIKHNSTIASLNMIIGKIFIDNEKERKIAYKYFKKLNVKAPSIDTNILTLSGGNQQKVVLAKWLMTNVKVLLLDEPTRGIDVGAKREIYNIITSLAKGGVGIIMVSSEMPELLAMCDRIVVLSNGKVQGEFNKDEVSQERIMKAATASNC